MRRKALPPLSRREREIMDILFVCSPASVAEVQAKLSDPPGYSAVRALLRILEEKGHLRHRESEGKYLYEPVASRESAAKSAFKNVLQTFFAGSLEKALAATFTDPRSKMTQEEYQRLADLIESARKKGG